MRGSQTRSETVQYQIQRSNDDNITQEVFALAQSAFEWRHVINLLFTSFQTTDSIIHSQSSAPREDENSTIICNWLKSNGPSILEQLTRTYQQIEDLGGFKSINEKISLVERLKPQINRLEMIDKVMEKHFVQKPSSKELEETFSKLKNSDLIQQNLQKIKEEKEQLNHQLNHLLSLIGNGASVKNASQKLEEQKEMMKRLNEQFSILKKNQEDMSLSNNNNMSQLKDKVNEISKLNLSIYEHEQENEALNRKIVEMQNQVEELKQKGIKIQTHNNELQKIDIELNQENSDKSKEIENLKKIKDQILEQSRIEKEKLTNDLNTKALLYNSLSLKLKELMVTNEENTRNFEKINEDIMRVTLELESEQQNGVLLKNEIREVNQLLENATKELSETKEENHQIYELVKELNRKLNLLENEIHSKNCLITEFENKIEASENEIQEKKGCMERINGLYQNLLKDFQQAEEEVSQLTIDNSMKNASFIDLTNKNSLIESQNSSQESEIISLQKNYQQLKLENEEIEQKVENITFVNDKLKKENSDKLKMINILNKEKEELKTCVRENISDLKAMQESHCNEINQLLEQKEQQDNEINLQIRKIDSLEHQNKDLSEQVSSINSQVGTLHENINFLNGELNETKENLQETENIKEKLNRKIIELNHGKIELEKELNDVKYEKRKQEKYNEIEKNELKSQIKILSKEKELLTQQSHEQKQEITNVKEIFENTKNDLISLTQKKEQIVLNLSSNEKEKTQQISNLHEQIHELKNDIEIRKETYQKLETINKSKSDVINTLQHEKETLLKKSQEKSKKIFELKSKIKLLEQNTQESTNQINEIKVLTDQKSEELTKIKLNVSSLEKEKEVLNQSNKGQTSKIESLENKVIEREKCIEDHIKQITVLNSVKNKQENEISLLKGHKTSLEESLQDLKNTLEMYQTNERNHKSTEATNAAVINSLKSNANKFLKEIHQLKDFIKNKDDEILSLNKDFQQKLNQQSEEIKKKERKEEFKYLRQVMENQIQNLQKVNDTLKFNYEESKNAEIKFLKSQLGNLNNLPDDVVLLRELLSEQTNIAKEKLNVNHIYTSQEMSTCHILDQTHHNETNDAEILSRRAEIELRNLYAQITEIKRTTEEKNENSEKLQKEIVIRIHELENLKERINQLKKEKEEHENHMNQKFQNQKNELRNAKIENRKIIENVKNEIEKKRKELEKRHKKEYNIIEQEALEGVRSAVTIADRSLSYANRIRNIYGGISVGFLTLAFIYIIFVD
ncbi:hypothetical protein TRFO_34704 [Tritrichomonas foetus]|uniref:Uncharacterized protein n=1 Tax=Tritrichomonas foetus TaxID=1144522 RepID=A0A1J4JNU6_9EUKA|nr:hypothetical protein TRFO_34704 [Tritrichomonas foetus]|eukprot:OHS98940.1 hypothetical protein TRFO_34704 [Tritrichomonas foetus]